MKRIFWLMLAIVVVATGMLLALRQYLYVEPVPEITVTTSEQEIVLKTEVYVSSDGERAVLEIDQAGNRIFLTFGEFNRTELDSAVSASGARYENLESGLEVWEKASNIVIYDGNTKLFESVQTLTGMAEADLVAYLAENSPWTWFDTVYASGAVIRPTKTDAFTISFETDGRVTGTTDCNGFSGMYRAVGDTFSFGSLMSTLMGCENTQENLFTGDLARVSGALVTNDGDLWLDLKDASGQMSFKPSGR